MGHQIMEREDRPEDTGAIWDTDWPEAWLAYAERLAEKWAGWQKPVES
jgi:hypothetical protein